MPELPNKVYLRASEIRAFLDVNKGTFRKMVSSPNGGRKTEARGQKLFIAIYLPGYAWPLFKRSQVVAALAKAEARD